MAARALVVCGSSAHAYTVNAPRSIQLTEQRATILKVSAEGMGGIAGGSAVIVDLLALEYVSVCTWKNFAAWCGLSYRVSARGYMVDRRRLMVPHV